MARRLLALPWIFTALVLLVWACSGVASAQSAKQITQFPLRSPVQSTDNMLLQGGGVGSPYYYAPLSGLSQLYIPVGGSLTSYSQLPALSANQVLGATSAGTPAGLTMPNCSAATIALGWVPGSGFVCNTISGGGGGGGTFTLSPGFASIVGTQNTGSQLITGGSTLSSQNWPEVISGTTYSVNYPTDTGAILLSNNATVGVAYTLRAPSSATQGTTSPVFADESGKGFTLTAAGGAASFYGFVGGGIGVTTATFSAYSIVQCSDDGANYFCATDQGYGQLGVATTAVVGGTNGYIFYDNNGFVGNAAPSAIIFTAGSLSLGGNLTTAGALTTTGTSAETLAFPGSILTYTFPSVTGTLATLGNVAQAFAGNLSFTNLATGTQVSCLGLTSGNAVVSSSGACGSGGGGSTTITLAPGFASILGTQNTGTQTVTNASTLYGQNWPKAIATTTYTVSYSADTGATLQANAASAVTFTLRNPASATEGSNSPVFQDIAGHGFTLTTVSGSADFYGWSSLSPTSASFPPYAVVQCWDDGTNYFCAATQPNVILPSEGWVAGVNPTNSVVISNLPSSYQIIGASFAEGIALGNTGTISVYIAPSGTACSAGTNISSGSFNANSTAWTNQNLTLTTTSVPAGDSICIQTTGGSNWTNGSSTGTVTVALSPT